MNNLHAEKVRDLAILREDMPSVVGARTCQRCAKRKPVVEFKIERPAGGRGKICRACDAARARARYHHLRIHNPEVLRQKARRTYYRDIERSRASGRARAATARGRELNKVAVARYARAHPDRLAAQKIARTAERRGEIKRAAVCEALGCGCRAGLHRHHPSYARPKLVVYLCRNHHEHVHHRGPLPLKQGSRRKFIGAPARSTTEGKLR